MLRGVLPAFILRFYCFGNAARDDTGRDGYCSTEYFDRAFEALSKYLRTPVPDIPFHGIRIIDITSRLISIIL